MVLSNVRYLEYNKEIQLRETIIIFLLITPFISTNILDIIKLD